MSDDLTPLVRKIAARLESESTAEPISMGEALQAIRDHADDRLSPATARLLHRIRQLWIAGLFPDALTLFVLDVGRELRAPGGGGS